MEFHTHIFQARNLWHMVLAALLGASISATTFALQDADEEPSAEQVVEEPTPPATPVDVALDLMRNGDMEAGIKELHRLGEVGDPAAFYHLAEIYRLGAGREQNIRVASMYYRFASGMGHARAALSLANLLYFETAGDEAVLEAINIWQQQALAGDGEARYMLGMLYWNGETGIEPDPIRGYGLVWSASDLGYQPAIESELAMAEQLTFEARMAGQDYAEKLVDVGFTGGKIAEDLLEASLAANEAADVEAREIAAAEAAAANIKLDKPESWSDVWHLEVGYAMGYQEAVNLRKMILVDSEADVVNLHSEIVESPSREGLYRLVFGPLTDMQSSVLKCVRLKKNGHDCFAKPPQTANE